MILIYSTNKNLIKCSLCSWKTLSWRTNKKGKKVSGYRKLQRHFSMAHEKEFNAIIEDLQEEKVGLGKEEEKK